MSRRDLWIGVVVSFVCCVISFAISIVDDNVADAVIVNGQRIPRSDPRFHEYASEVQTVFFFLGFFWLILGFVCIWIVRKKGHRFT